MIPLKVHLSGHAGPSSCERGSYLTSAATELTLNRRASNKIKHIQWYTEVNTHNYWIHDCVGVVVSLCFCLRALSVSSFVSYVLCFVCVYGCWFGCFRLVPLKGHLSSQAGPRSCERSSYLTSAITEVTRNKKTNKQNDINMTWTHNENVSVTVLLWMPLCVLCCLCVWFLCRMVLIYTYIASLALDSMQSSILFGFAFMHLWAIHIVARASQFIPRSLDSLRDFVARLALASCICWRSLVRLQTRGDLVIRLRLFGDFRYLSGGGRGKCPLVRYNSSPWP